MSLISLQPFHTADQSATVASMSVIAC